MKKTFKFFAAALAIVAAASCAKEISNDDIQAPEQELVHKVFTASLNVDPDTETKTTLHEDGVTVHWAEDDVIKLLPVNSASGTNFSVVSCDGPFADFEGETVDATSYRAVYPASILFEGLVNSLYTESDYYILADATSKCALAHQYAVEGNFSIVKELGTSSNFAISTYYSENGNLYFKNINAYLKVRLSMENAASIHVSAQKVMCHPDAIDVGTQSLSDAAKLGGPIAIDYAHKNKMGIITRVGEDITFEKQDGSNLLPNVDYYIAIPAVKMEGLKLVVKDENGKVLQSLTKSTFTPSSNTIYNLGTIEPAPIAPAANVGDYFYSDGTYSSTLDASKTVVGIVFYAGDPKTAMNDEALPDEYCHGLAIRVSPVDVFFHKSSLNVTDADLKKTSTSDMTNYSIGGYTVKSKWSKIANLSLYTTDCGDLPDNTTDWYFGTPKEWNYIMENRNLINSKRNELGYANIFGDYDIYVLPIYKDATKVWSIKYRNGVNYAETWWQSSGTYYTNQACPIFAF